MKKFIYGLSSLVILSSCSAAITDTKERAYEDFVSCKYAYMKGETVSAYLFCKDALKEDPNSLTIYEELIKITTVLGKDDEARKYIKEMLSKFKNNPEAYNYAAKAYKYLHDDKNLKKVVLEGVQKFPNNVPLLKKLGDIYIKEGNLEESVAVLQKLIKLDPDNKKRYYFLMAKLYTYADQDKKAEEILKKAYKENPSDIDYLIYIGDLYYSKGNLKEAERAYEEALKKTPNNIKLLEKLFQLYVLFDEYDKAEKTINKIVEIDPFRKDALLKKYLLYLRVGKAKEIVKDLEVLAKKYPDDPKVLSILGMAYDYLKDYDKAIKTYKKALKLNPDNKDELLERMATIYIDLGKYKEAEKIANELIKSDPLERRYYLLLADIKDKEGKTEEAIKVLKEAEESLPEDEKAVIYFMEGVYYDRLNKWKEAEEALKKALEIRQNYPDALNYLGYSYIVRDIDINKGIELVKKALELSPENPAYLDSLAWGYYKLGKLKEAYKYIKKAYEQMSDDPVLTFHYGAILEKLGKKEEALNLYKKALKLLGKLKEEPEPGLKENILKHLKKLEGK